MGETGSGAALPPLSHLDTLLYAAAIGGFVAIIVLSALLHPVPGGVGTHTQLHLPPCGVMVLTGKPCPSCGMTTSFAWMVRGRVLKAFQVQPAGVAVFLSVLAWWIYLPVALLRRCPFAHLFEMRAFLPNVVGLIVLILAVWGLRLGGWG
jgi:hypothetical protein